MIFQRLASFDYLIDNYLDCRNQRRHDVMDPFTDMIFDREAVSIGELLVYENITKLAVKKGETDMCHLQ